MAVGTVSNFVIYDEHFHSGRIEFETQNINGFNEASNGTIQVITEAQMGDYNRESFLKDFGDLTDRDPTSTSALTPSALTRDERIGVKVDKTFGPFSHTRSAFTRSKMTGEDFSFAMGMKFAEKKQKAMLNSGLVAVVAALLNQSAVVHTSTGSTLDHSDLADIMGKRGDRMGDIAAWVMHSKVVIDLLKSAITNTLWEATGLAVLEGIPATMGKPIVMVDDPALIGGTTSVPFYHTLGLARGGVSIIESETDEVWLEKVTGGANLYYQSQGESAYNVNVEGFKWDTTNGGTSPNAATLGTGSNWDPVATSFKSYAGAIGTTL